MSRFTFIALALILTLANVTRAVPVNLAPGGTATSSSTLGACCGSATPFFASRANDGNRDGSSNSVIFHTNDPDTAAFFQVDLGANSFLDRIELFPRTNAVQNSVENFRIDVFNTAGINVFSKNYLTASNTGDKTWGTTDIRNVEGSRIRLTRLDGSPSFLTFAEFEVYGQSSPISFNLAKGAALTSSSLPGFGSQNADAIDGDINGHFFRPDTSGIGSSGPVYHTADQGAGEFLQLDLGTSQKMDYINLFSRTDGATTSQVQLTILAADGVTTVFSQLLNLTGTDLGAARYGQTLDLPAVDGRFVRLTTVGNEFLAFAEIEVFSQIPEPATGVLGMLALAALGRRGRKERAITYRA